MAAEKHLIGQLAGGCHESSDIALSASTDNHAVRHVVPAKLFAKPDADFMLDE